MNPLRYLRSIGETVKRSCTYSTTAEYPHPFEEIPGPRSLPLVGTLYKYLPYFGEYSFDRLHETGAKKLSRYGPLVREEIVPGVFTVWVFRPDDIAEIFKTEVGSHPERRSHLALQKYRRDRSKIYNPAGLLHTNGPDWWKIRKEFQKALSKPRSIVIYVENTDQVVKNFVELCGRGTHEDLLPLLSRLYLELICLAAFDVKFGSFSAEEMCENSRSSRLIAATLETNSAILALDNGPRLWRFFDTPLYKKLCRSQEYIESVAVDMVSRKIKELATGSTGENESLLETYLKNPNLDEKDVVGMACDMLLAGMDTTSYTTSFALYHLATNLEAQEKLYQEAAMLLPDVEDPVTSDVLKRASYTKAAIKESLRLNPIAVGVGRVLKTDTVLNGYRVPAETVAVTQNQVICRLPEHFSEPDSFIPERWLRDADDKTNKKPVHPYLVIPFGHGPRSCIARRLAEQNMQITLLNMCRKFKFEWKGGKLDCKSLLINLPDAPIKLSFQRR